MAKIMKDFYTCDGSGNTDSIIEHPNRVTRRAVLGAGAGIALASALAIWAGNRSALAQVTVAPKGLESQRDILVNIFLRGAADGLSLVVPYGEDEYFKARPTLAIAAPSKSNSGSVLDLNGFFGLHPALSPLLPLYRDGSLAVLHAVGSGDQTRSHFEAMATMERGEYKEAGREARGWLARHLDTVTGTASPLRAVAFGTIMPDTLRGATSATAVNSLSDLQIHAPRPELESAFHALYATGTDAASIAGRETLAAMETLRKIDPAHYKPANSAVYPASPLGDGLKQTACLVKAGVGTGSRIFGSRRLGYACRSGGRNRLAGFTAGRCSKIAGRVRSGFRTQSRSCDCDCADGVRATGSGK